MKHALRARIDAAIARVVELLLWCRATSELRNVLDAIAPRLTTAAGAALEAEAEVQTAPVAAALRRLAGRAAASDGR
jgi:hypothetical protein